MLTECFILAIIGLSYSVSMNAENRLHHELLHIRSYSKLIRPTGNDSLKLTVKIGLRLSQLLDIDEKNQIMTTSVWLRQEWTDPRLQWDPKEYQGIKMTHMPSDHLWRPDIVLYNNADGDFVITLLTKAKVYFDGMIIWEPPVIYKSSCPIDVEYFPFDMQECFMKFSSWTYDGQELDLQHVCDAQSIILQTAPNEPKEKLIIGGVDIHDYHQNVEWDIINVTAKRKEKLYPCCPNAPYPYLLFNITLRRRTLFYSLNLIMPCVSISCLTVLVFYLPSDSGEKITLSISILLALTVFFLLLSDINPPTSFVIPLIGKYLLFTMIVVTMSIFLTVYTLGIHFRRPATHTMSPWVRRVFTEILPRVLLMRRPDMEHMRKRVPLRTCNGIEMRDVRDILSASQASESTYENIRPNKELKQYPKEITEAFEGVISIADHLKTEDQENSEARDWKYIAMVMDRLFLYIFTTACVCGTLSIFLYAPSLYDSRPPLSSNIRAEGACKY
ncbi:acetylcholine receptor subunit alpha-L1-like [Mytilus trossulus]|uniref:acetylcholine receptor subunit alpha-L1-like n=1 Tax=Mytilus trossulus TaxID=6551 RepID=UPI0030050AC2